MQRNTPPPSDASRFREDRRGVSEVLGAMLIFALLVILIVVVQATAVPAANQQVEFDHSQRVSQDLQALDEAVYRVAASGRGESAAVELGVTYPPRFFLLNPPPATGHLDSRPQGTITLQNVRATSPETADYLDGGPVTFDTRSYRYSAEYNQYHSAPTMVYEGSVLYNQNPQGNETVIDGGAIISGDRITLVTLAGDLSMAGVTSQSLNLQPVSAPSQRITVTNEGNQNVTLRVPTTLPENRWEELLEEEMVDQGGHVVDVRYQTGSPYNTVVIELERGVDYQLRLARIGVGGETGETSAAHYLAAPEGTNRTVQPGTSTTLSVEVRDRYNNVVAGQSVTFSTTGGTFGNGQQTVTVQTGDDGRATVQFTPSPGATGTVSVTASADLAPGDLAREKVVFRTEVDTSAGQRPDYVDQGVDAGVEITNVQTAKRNNVNYVDVAFKNVAGTERTLESVRMPIYYYWSPQASPTGRPVSYRLTTGTGPQLVTRATGEITGPIVQVNPNVVWTDGQTRTLSFAFYNANGDNVPAERNHFFIVRFYFKSGHVSTYYIQIPS